MGRRWPWTEPRRCPCVWPSVVTEGGGPVKALFHAMTRDGRTFPSANGFPPAGHANHPQFAIDAAGTLAATWDESGSGTRVLALATGRLDGEGRVRFVRTNGSLEVGTYPVVVSTQTGVWLRAWTTGQPNSSTIRVAPLS